MLLITSPILSIRMTEHVEDTQPKLPKTVNLFARKKQVNLWHYGEEGQAQWPGCSSSFVGASDLSVYSFTCTR
jgi:hypothetical protein